MLNIANLKMQIAKNQYMIHDTDSALAIDTTSGIMQFFTKSRPPKSLPAIETEVMPKMIEEIRKPVLPLINKSLIVCLYGAQDAGKTTLLCHVIESRRNEPALILDPHGYAGKYPHGEMKGIGRNYDEIESCMKWAISEVNARYQTYKGQPYSPLTIYVDELTLLSDFCPSFKQFMRVMTTESRKIGIRLVFCVHSNRAEIIGLKGNYDLADGMLFVSLFNDNGNRYAEVKKQIYELPGAYQVVRQSANQAYRQPQEAYKARPDRYDSHDKYDYPDYRKIEYDSDMGGDVVYDEPIRFFESKAQKTAYELSKKGLTPYQIAKKIFPFVNGQKTAKIKQWLSEM